MDDLNTRPPECNPATLDALAERPRKQRVGAVEKVVVTECHKVGTRRPAAPPTKKAKPGKIRVDEDNDGAIAKRDPRDIDLEAGTLTATGIVWHAEATFEQWDNMGLLIDRCGSAVNWWIGDWINYGEERPDWGHKYDQYMKKFGLKEQTLKNIALVCRRIPHKSTLKGTFPPPKGRGRRVNLPWTHHRAVAYLPDPVRDNRHIPREFSPRRENSPPVEGGRRASLPWSHHKAVAYLPDPVRDKMNIASVCRHIPREFSPQEENSPPKGRGRRVNLPGTYRVILADPPWKYNDERTGTEEAAAHGEEGGRGKKKTHGQKNPKGKRDESKRALAQVARAVGMSRTTLEKTGEVVRPCAASFLGAQKKCE